MPESDFAHYKILGLLGRGGMGEVHRALDTKLGREVALKVLPEDFAHDPERLARFKREAKVLASLQHPNIAGIFGLEEDNKRVALAMELAEGSDLTGRIDQGAAPEEEVLDIARQIAAGLEEAHEKGVVHRDLKPANIKLGTDGKVKILDFGLARAFAGETAGEENMEHSPTITAAMSHGGVILGTAAYMSPEQARGRKVDRRADIWSFGVVVYELLTGKKLFQGETISDTLASVLREEINWEQLPEDTSPGLIRLLERCLERDPLRRLRDIGEARVFLEDGAKDSSLLGSSSNVHSGIELEDEQRARGISFGPALGIGAALALLGLLAGWKFLAPQFSEEPTPPTSIRFEVSAPPGASLAVGPYQMAISPTGENLVFLARGDDGTQLHLRPLNSLESTPIPGTESGFAPFWSPDGEKIAFNASGKLRTVSIVDGETLALFDVASGRGGSWGKDYILHARGQGPLYRIPARGGTPEPATTLNEEEGETNHRFPHFLPDGETFLYVSLPSRLGLHKVFVGHVDGRPPVHILDSVASPIYVEPGYLIYQRAKRLIAQRFDVERLELLGDPISIGAAPRRPQASGSQAASVSRNGHLIYPNTRERLAEFVWMNRAGDITGSINIRPGDYIFPDISPDGSRVAFAHNISPEESEIFVYEFGRNILERFTTGTGLKTDPKWSPDGSSLAYSMSTDGPWRIYREHFPGGGGITRITDNPATFKNPNAWSPDGKHFLYEQLGSGTRMDLWISPTDSSGGDYPYVNRTTQEQQADFSTDGNWIVYTEIDNNPNIYINSFPSPGQKLRLTSAAALAPQWITKNEILFRGARGDVMSVRVETEPRLRAETPEFLFTFSGPLTATSDGSRLLALRDVDEGFEAKIVVITNWLNAFPALSSP